MAAYLVVDVDDLLRRFQAQNVTIDLQELAVGLRGAAALAAGLVNPSTLKAIAVANWSTHGDDWHVTPQTIFRSAGYEIFDSPSRDDLADVLIIHYFSYDPDPVDELILATTSRDLLPLIRRIKTTRSARIRMWGSEDVLQGTAFADEIIFQPLETLLGIQTKNVAVYIDFENISISLNEQGFMVNLDHLIQRFVSQAQANGNVIKMSAYAPWGQRGTLPPLVDSSGREVANDAPSRLMMANIDPVFNLPGKNSADIRIARDVITDASHPESADVIIMASGDRDFNEVINALVQKNKVVIVWGVRGSTSRQLENHPSIVVEYIDDFTDLQTHQSLSQVELPDDSVEGFIPSQWSSVIIQFHRLNARHPNDEITTAQLISQLETVGAVVSQDRGEDLVSQSISLGIIKPISANGEIELNLQHPVVEKTLLIMDRIARRVANTLQVRGWEYVNYGFLLKGLEMEHDLERRGMNDSDQWRSHWIDCLVREGVLQRQLVPHRHNPDDLVPVIHIADDEDPATLSMSEISTDSAEEIAQQWVGIPPHQLHEHDLEASLMVTRIVISVEQFTSFRSFAWCPLGSLHRRLRDYDTGIAFQRAVEYMLVNDMAIVNEYSNPQSNYNTKGIELRENNTFVAILLAERDEFIRILLEMYNNNIVITHANIDSRLTGDWDIALWISIMETENILNPLPGRTDQYSLFRTHHTVKLVANDDMEKDED
jgi:uncharacterized LabA/DUF88 family protein